MLSQNLVKMTWVLLYEIYQNALFLATKIVRFYSYLLTLNQIEILYRIILCIFSSYTKI